MRPLLTPKWLLSHLFVLAMVVSMVNLGFWQLRRLDERRDRNVEDRTAMEAPPAAIASFLGTDAADHTAVIVAGEYVAEQSFLIANRTFGSQPGAWLATPLRMVDGRIVVVSRGWVPRRWTAGDDPRIIDTPAGEVEVTGRLNASVGGGRIGGGATAVLPEISRMDLGRVEELLGIDVAERWVQLVAQTPTVGELPLPVPPPSLDEGTHLSYAFQWFFFSTGTVVAYALILLRR